MYRRTVMVVGAAVALLVGALAVPASAHATFQGVKSAPAGTDVQLTLNVPEEEGPTVHNIGVAARLPAGWTAVACAPIAGWQCVMEPSPVVIRWTRDPGAPDVAQETFAFTAHTGPAGAVTVPVIQTYAGGEVVEWIGAKGSESPAPSFTVTPAAAASPSPASPSPTASPAASPSASPSPSPAVSPAETPSPSPSPPVVAGEQQRPARTLPRTGTNSALPLVIVLLLAALGGAGLLVSRRRKKPAA